MIHLICLRCNRANASEAKFCSECGAGLLRKFCSRCHAINDAESHFCQSCGEALPAQPSAPQGVPMKPPAVVPDLTDVYAGPDEPAPALAESPADSRWREQETAVVPVVASSLPETERIATLPSQRTVLFGFVGGAAVLLAALLWSRAEHPNAVPAEAPTAMPAPTIVAPATAPVVAMPAPVPQPPPTTVPDNPARTDAASGAATTARPAPTKEPNKAPERRLAPDAQIAAQPPAAGPPRSATVERKPIVRSTPPPTSPVLDCTPQVDALGLCAPGAKVADKSGSR